MRPTSATWTATSSTFFATAEFRRRLMDPPCLSTALTSAEFAAWVQAIGSIVAILAAALIAIWQARVQHRGALALQIAEHERVRVELGKTLSVLAASSVSAVAHISQQLSTRDAVHNVGHEELFLDLGEVRRLDASLAHIPLHGLPETLVTPTMILSALVRQYLAKVEMALRVHRQMDAAAFEDLFEFFEFTNTGLNATRQDIANEVSRMQKET